MNFVVTDDTRNFILHEMMTELEEREYTYSKEALEKILDECFKQKANLIEMFRKHPNWDEKHLMIHFDRDIERRINLSVQNDFIHNVFNSDSDKTSVMKNTITKSFDYTWYAPETLFNDIYILPCETIIPDDKSVIEILERINSTDSSFHFRPGMKTNRVLNKIFKKYGFDKVPGYDRKFAEYSDAVTPMKVTRHTTISVNPIDFLLMSNGNSWKSCHYIGDYSSDAGCYSSGTISYMLDTDSFIVSTIDKDIDREDIERAQKTTRQVFGYNDFQLFQSRMYPQNCDSGAQEAYQTMRNIVEDIISKCTDIPNVWADAELDVKHGDYATCYPDWKYNRLCNKHVLSSKNDDPHERIVMGAQPICITCGKRHRESENISCCDTNKKCTKCGASIDEDRIIWVDGDAYCNDCAGFCEKCGKTYVLSDMTGIGDYYYCVSCRDDNFAYCEECDEYYDIDEVTWVESENRYVCDDCLERWYEQCEKCEEWFLRSKMTQLRNKDTAEIIYVCNSCAEEYSEEEWEQL